MARPVDNALQIPAVISRETAKAPKKIAPVAKSGKAQKRKRTLRPYPASSFEEALELAEQIQRFAAGPESTA